MALSNNELSAIRTDLIALHTAAFGIDRRDGKQGRTFIEVGEYGLALDEIAYAYLDSGTTMPSEMVKTFEKLATMMELDKDAEFNGVARLRARAKEGSA